MEADFYSVYDSKVDATIAWYTAHLAGFQKTHAYAAKRSQDTFYRSDGTVIVSITGSVGNDGETRTPIRCCTHTFSRRSQRRRSLA